VINIITNAQQQIKSQVKQLHVILIIRRALHIQQWVKSQIKQSTSDKYNYKGTAADQKSGKATTCDIYN
jgi:hypothetical protein